MAKVHVKITDLESGKVLVDQDTPCFIGAMSGFGDDEDGVKVLGSTDAGALSIAHTIVGVQGVINMLLQNQDICAAKNIAEFLHGEKEAHGDEE